MPDVQTRKLSVYANPYVYVDHLGRLAGACPFDPDFAAGERRYIGAEVDVEKTKIVTKRGALDPRGDRTDIVWAYSTGPVSIPDSATHRRYLQHGDILPATEREHRLARVAGEFVDPLAKLASLRAEALFAWAQRREGEAPAFATEQEESLLEAAKDAKDLVQICLEVVTAQHAAKGGDA